MKTLKKLLFVIMSVVVLAMPVFYVQAAESDISVTEQSLSLIHISEPTRQLE